MRCGVRAVRDLRCLAVRSRGSVRGVSSGHGGSSGAALSPELQRMIAELEALPTAQRELVLGTLPLSQASARRAFAAADLNKDGTVSLVEFQTWYTRRGLGPVSSFAEPGGDAMGAAMGGSCDVSVAAGALAAMREEAPAALAPSTLQLRRELIFAAVPFIGFGFLDNAIMISAGDAIESNIGGVLCLSTMAAAGLGNMVSDIVGMGATGYIERYATKLGLPNPGLTAAQRQLPKVKQIGLLGAILGISIGCILGMAPLLFIDSERKELRKSFDVLDGDGNGFISREEIALLLKMLGMRDVKEAQVDGIVDAMDTDHDHRISFEEFCMLHGRLLDYHAAAVAMKQQQ
jgi:hypothetical protein